MSLAINPQKNQAQPLSIALTAEEQSNQDALRKVISKVIPKIEEQYKDLPLPKDVRNISLLTETPGGRGDIVAAAKVIELLEKISPFLTFNWLVQPCRHEADKFLRVSNPSNVKLSWNGSDEVNADLLITGPAETMWGIKYIEKKFNLNLNGPEFKFLEAGTSSNYPFALKFSITQSMLKNENQSEVNSKSFSEAYERMLSTKPLHGRDGTCMGIGDARGLFFDQSRIDTTLSREYCCPKPLLKIEDNSLRNDILGSLGSKGENQLPDYDHYSFNSGYAHRPSSWGKFIDLVAIHEQGKHVTIVLNQYGEFDRPNITEYCNVIFTPERLKLLQDQGYGNIAVKGEGDEEVTLQKSKDEPQRNLTVILRPSFSPSDMKQLQLASERLIATGMNSPAESWASRCKLFLYEDVGNGGVTHIFLEQQIQVANEINPKLGRLLELSGKKNSPLTKEEMEEVITLLQDPEISEATLKFCKHVTSHYRFEDAFISSLKRAIWHYKKPELINIEAEAIDEEFKQEMLNCLEGLELKERVINIHNIPLIGERVQEAVSQYLESIVE
ncbi:MAG: DUF562 domain-containing protein [Chlamydiota bacterium]|nr:DUF562 domain-containing protein [Chlamydiota bacterium]